LSLLIFTHLEQTLNFNSNFTDSGTNYNVTKTTTSFGAYHAEDDSECFFKVDATFGFSTRNWISNFSFETGTPNNEAEVVLEL
jgi:hypothetical protein